jgi:hypothetical protein
MPHISPLGLLLARLTTLHRTEKLGIGLLIGQLGLLSVLALL